MSEQSAGFEIRPVIEQKPFKDKTVQSFFAKWCKRNNHIEPKVIERDEWEEKENILEKRDNGKGNLYIPKDLQLWEMIPIIETIDKDTFINKPGRQDEGKEKIIELGKTFREAGIYIAKRLDSINEGKEMAIIIAEEFYNYGESIISGKKSKKDKTIEEIKLQELTEEETNKVDCFLAGEELFKSRRDRAIKEGISIEDERQKTLNQFFRVSEEAFNLQQKSASGELKKTKTKLKPWQRENTFHNQFISKINESIKREIETPDTELYSSIFRRGMDMLQEYMPFDKLPESVKDNYLHWKNGETTLRKALQIDQLKSELDSIRLSGDMIDICDKEREISNKIQKAVSNFPYKELASNISEMIKNQKIDCLGASMLGGALMQEVGLNYLVGGVPKHSILFLITSDNKVEWRDMLSPYISTELNDNEIEGQNSDGSPITINDILEFSKNPKSVSLTFDIKGEEYRKKFSWVKEGQRQFVTIFKPDEGQQIQALNNIGYALVDLGLYKKAIKAYEKAINIDPEYIDIYNNLGIALSNLGRNEEAIEAYKIFVNQTVDKQKYDYFIKEAERKIAKLERKEKSKNKTSLASLIKKIKEHLYRIRK